MKRACKEFCVCFFVPAIMICGAAVFHYFTIIKAERGPLEASEQLGVALGTSAIERELQSVVSDLKYLAQRIESENPLESADQGELDMMRREFRMFTVRQPVYHRVQFLDSTGAEVVNVRSDQGMPVMASAGDPENQNNRQYFIESWALDRGQVYVSPLVVNGAPEQTGRLENSVLRFATPVYGSNGTKRGVLVLNYRGAGLTREFDTAVSNIADHVMLVDADGWSLRIPRTENESAFEYVRNSTFRDTFPAIWDNIRDTDSGQIYAPDGLFSFSTVGLPYHWKIVSYAAADNLGVGARLRQDIPLYVLIFAVLVLISMMLTGARLRNRKIAAEIEFERRFRETLENIDLLALGIDSDGSITFCNESLLGLTGWQRDELLAKDWLEYLVPTELRKQYALEFQRRLSGSDTPKSYVAEIQTRDGARRVISWSDAVLSDNDGKLLGTIQIGKDITESRRTRDQLRKLSSAVEQSPSVVMIVDLQGRIEYVNPKFTQSTGYTLEEVVGRNPRVLKSGETSFDEYKKLWSTITAGGEWRGVFHNQKKSGELFWEAASISPIRDSAGVITHFLAVKEDITERKRLEEEVETREREISRNRELAVMGRMASMIAHDLRNPLSSIKMALQILGEKAVRIWRGDEDEPHMIALEQVGYMEEILDDLLSFSRPDALKPEWVGIRKILDQTIIACQKQIDEFGARIDTWYQPGLPTLHADPRKLRQVFSNIIMNALQASEGLVEHRPEITVTVQIEIGAEQPQIRVDIYDNGCGFEPDQQNKLCEPFFTTRAKGTGLGLAIVKRIVVQHCGSVSFAPVQDGGTRVSVVLPTGPISANHHSDHILDVSNVASDSQRATVN